MIEALNAIIGNVWTRYRGCLIEKKSDNEFLVFRFHICKSLAEAKIYIDESLEWFNKK